MKIDLKGSQNRERREKGDNYFVTVAGLAELLRQRNQLAGLTDGRERYPLQDESVTDGRKIKTDLK